MSSKKIRSSREQEEDQAFQEEGGGSGVIWIRKRIRWPGEQEEG